MDIIPFRPEHLAGIDPPAMTPHQLAFFCRHYRPHGPAWTGMAAGRVVGCGGIIAAGDTATAWLVLSHPTNALAVHRAARRILNAVVKETGVRRIEARALAYWHGACRWLELLGFRPAGIEGAYRRYER